MKKMIAPTFFALLFIAIIALYIRLVLHLPIAAVYKALIAAGLGALAVAMGYVLFKRRREIEEEDQDDLGKY